MINTNIFYVNKNKLPTVDNGFLHVVNRNDLIDCILFMYFIRK